MPHYRSARADAMARGLGWFSLGLGLAELTAGRAVGRWLGMEGSSGAIRAYGLREIVQGFGLLAIGDRRPWMWGRVAGDALDLATLSAGLGRDNPKRGNVALAMGAVAAVAAVDLTCVRALHADEARRPVRRPDYSRRSGFPRPVSQMRGTAKVPESMRPPPLMRYERSGGAASPQP